MEMELKEKLEFTHILKQALKILSKNISIAVFSLLASLPLFYSMYIYEMIFQKVVVEASYILDPPHGPFYYTWPVPVYISRRLTKPFLHELFHLALLYLFPLYISEFFSMSVTVNLASKVYLGETPMTLKEMVISGIKKTRWEGIFVTSFYALILSTCTLLGLIWLVTNYYFIARHGFYGYFFAGFYGVAFVVLLRKYLEWSAVWNMGIVVSTLEEVYGTRALVVSLYFSRGSEEGGLLLMLIFFVWGFGLRLSCLCVGCYERGSGVLVQVGLFCLGNVMKWVVCMVYYYDCKTRILEIKDDVEVGGEVENVDAEAFEGSQILQGGG